MRLVHARLIVIFLAIVSAAAASGAATPPAAPKKNGPLAVGDPVEVSFGGKWIPGGVVTWQEGLAHFVHWGDGRFDTFYHLYELRAVGQAKPLAETYRDSFPDPQGGPVAIGETVEVMTRVKWEPCRVVRRLGERYEIYPESEVTRYTHAAMWIGPDEMRRPGQTQPIGPKPAPPAKPTKLSDVKVGDLVEGYQPSFAGWREATVTAIGDGRYYLRRGPDSAIKGWVTPVHMRPVGSKERFEPEDLKQFVGTFVLAGDAFFTTSKSVNKGDHVEKTMTLSTGAGQFMGTMTIKPDGTYVLSKTAVYQDDKPGKWVRNPNQDEGGILLKEADSPGKDVLVTPYRRGGLYVQGARGPGKIATPAGK